MSIEGGLRRCVLLDGEAHPSSMLQVTTVSASSPPSSCLWLAGLASTLQAPLSISWPTPARTLAGADLHASLSHPADSEDARSEGPIARLVRGFWACCSVQCDTLQLSLVSIREYGCHLRECTCNFTEKIRKCAVADFRSQMLASNV